MYVIGSIIIIYIHLIMSILYFINVKILQTLNFVHVFRINYIFITFCSYLCEQQKSR